MDQWARLDTMAWQDSREQQDSQAQLVPLDRREIKDQGEVKVRSEHRDQLVRQVPSGRLDHLETVDLRDQRVKREQLGQQDIAEIRVCQEILERQV